MRAPPRFGRFGVPLRILALVGLCVGLVPEAHAKPRKHAPAGPAPLIVQTADVPEASVGGAHVRPLIQNFKATKGAADLLLVSLPKDAKVGLSNDGATVAVYVLEGEVHAKAPGKKGEPALDSDVGPNSALYSRPPHREGLEIVGGAELSRLVVAKVPFAGKVAHGHGVAPVLVAADAAQELEIGGGKGGVKIFFEEKNTQSKALYLGRFRAENGLSIPEHAHAAEAEVLYIYSGFGELALQGKVRPVTAGDAVYIPPGTPHAFKVTSSEPVKAVQVYTPNGPEQRFKKPPLAASASKSP